MATHTRHVVFGLVVAMVFGLAASVCAQTQVRVKRDGAIIWGREARVPLTTVKSGTVLDVVGRDGDWYIVIVPPDNGGRGETGLIAATGVEETSGVPTPPQRPGGARTPSPGANAPQTTRGRAPAPPPAAEVFLFGQVGYATFLAHDTFNAIFGSPGLPAFGAGAHVNVAGRWFVDGSFDWIQKTGERVVVSDGQAFPLGISDRVRMVPVAINGGYRFRGRSVSTYIGGGAGAVFYQETSDFADPSENVSETFASYQAVVGFEIGKPRSQVRGAIEFQFSTVPGAIGTSGASAAFNESNLGAFQIRFKLMAGR